MIETAHLTSSPRRPEGGGQRRDRARSAGPFDRGDALASTCRRSDCPNVTAFQVNVDSAAGRASIAPGPCPPRRSGRPATETPIRSRPPDRARSDVGALDGARASLCMPGQRRSAGDAHARPGGADRGRLVRQRDRQHHRATSRRAAAAARRDRGRGRRHAERRRRLPGEGGDPRDQRRGAPHGRDARKQRARRGLRWTAPIPW